MTDHALASAAPEQIRRWGLALSFFLARSVANGTYPLLGLPLLRHSFYPLPIRYYVVQVASDAVSALVLAALGPQVTKIWAAFVFAAASLLVVRLLHPVLPEVPDAGGEGGAHRVGGVRLADGHEGDLARRSRRALRRPGDPLPDGGHAVRDHFFMALSSPWAVATFWASVGFMLRYFSRCAIASGIFPWPTISAPSR